MAGKEMHKDTSKEGKPVAFADNRTIIGLVVLLLLAVFGIRGMVRDLTRPYDREEVVADSTSMDALDSLRLGYFPEGTVIVMDSLGMHAVLPDTTGIGAGEGARE